MKKLFINIFILLSFLLSLCGSVFASVYFGPTWDSFPLRVYIPENQEYSTKMENAFKKWQAKSSNRISFVFVDEDDAQIVVNFVDEVDGSDGDIGAYDVIVRGGNIVGAQIYIIKNEDKRYSGDMIYTVMLHEIGHVLGLPDSKKHIGIMQTPVTESQDLIMNDIVRVFRFNGWSVINNGNGIK